MNLMYCTAYLENQARRDANEGHGWFSSHEHRSICQHIVKNYGEALETPQPGISWIESEAPARCSKRPFSEAAAGEEATHTLGRMLSL
jgi:hypothetical protein